MPLSSLCLLKEQLYLQSSSLPVTAVRVLFPWLFSRLYFLRFFSSLPLNHHSGYSLLGTLVSKVSLAMWYPEKICTSLKINVWGQGPPVSVCSAYPIPSIMNPIQRVLKRVFWVNEWAPSHADCPHVPSISTADLIYVDLMRLRFSSPFYTWASWIPEQKAVITDQWLC